MRRGGPSHGPPVIPAFFEQTADAAENFAMRAAAARHRLRRCPDLCGAGSSVCYLGSAGPGSHLPRGMGLEGG